MLRVGKNFLKGMVVLTNVAIIIGSLRKESVSRKIAKNVAKYFPEGFNAEIVEIGDLPMYNQDFDDHNEVPESYTIFRNRMKEKQAVLFITPEYNRSIPGVLKNALDVGSRPYGSSIWDGKPAAIISHSIGNLSGFGANHHLRQCLVFLNMPTMAQPEAYLANSANLLGAEGNIQNPDTEKFLQNFVDRFVDWIRRFT